EYEHEPIRPPFAISRREPAVLHTVYCSRRFRGNNGNDCWNGRLVLTVPVSYPKLHAMPNNEKLNTKRHSLAHIMAASIQELFPEAKFGVGPVVEDGFYYDVHLNRSLTPEDLQTIEKRMRDKIKQNLRFERLEVPLDEAADVFAKMSQDFKVELLRDLKLRGTTAVADAGDANLVGGSINQVSVYKTGNFTDLCRGPHVTETRDIDPDSFRLTRVSGAYWRGNQER